MNRIVITGMGWVTPMGHSIDAVWKRLLNGESGIAKTTIFDASTFPTTFSAEVKDYRLEEFVPGHPVFAPGGVPHWHGATPDSALTQTSLNFGDVKWLGPVSDAEYERKKP